MPFMSRYTRLAGFAIERTALERWLLTVVVLVLIIGLWYVTIFGMLHTQYVNRTKHKQEFAAQQALYQEQSAHVHQLQQQVSTLTHEWVSQTLSVTEKNQQDALFSLFQLCTVNNVTLDAYYPGQLEDGSWYAKQSLEVHLTGSFESLCALCLALSDEAQPFACSEIRLERRDNSISTVCSLYCKTPKGVDYDVA